MKTDLTYKTDGLFATFYVNSRAGLSAYKELCDKLGGQARVLAIHLPSTLAQLKKAGYGVRNTTRTGKPNSEKFTDSDAKLLEKLGI